MFGTSPSGAGSSSGPILMDFQRGWHQFWPSSREEREWRGFSSFFSIFFVCFGIWPFCVGSYSQRGWPRWPCRCERRAFGHHIGRVWYLVFGRCEERASESLRGAIPQYEKARRQFANHVAMGMGFLWSNYM